jgi:hypothetical protein
VLTKLVMFGSVVKVKQDELHPGSPRIRPAGKSHCHSPVVIPRPEEESRNKVRVEDIRSFPTIPQITQ